MCALPAVRELHQYLNNPEYVTLGPQLELLITNRLHNRKAVRMGQHAWLLLATVV